MMAGTIADATWRLDDGGDVANEEALARSAMDRSGKLKVNAKPVWDVTGISQRRLGLTLKRLETDGSERERFIQSEPPRVEYEVTALGRDLRGALVPLDLCGIRLR